MKKIPPQRGVLEGEGVREKKKNVLEEGIKVSMWKTTGQSRRGEAGDGRKRTGGQPKNGSCAGGEGVDGVHQKRNPNLQELTREESAAIRKWSLRGGPSLGKK